MKSIIKHRNFSKGALILVVALTLQSCFVAQDYVRPDLPEVTQELYRTDNLPIDSLSMADLSWKTMFKDSVLQSYIEEGLENNMDVRIAIQQMNAAQAYAKQGKAGFQPTLNVGPIILVRNFQKIASLVLFLVVD